MAPLSSDATLTFDKAYLTFHAHFSPGLCVSVVKIFDCGERLLSAFPWFDYFDAQRITWLENLYAKIPTLGRRAVCWNRPPTRVHS